MRLIMALLALMALLGGRELAHASGIPLPTKKNSIPLPAKKPVSLPERAHPSKTPPAAATELPSKQAVHDQRRRSASSPCVEQLQEIAHFVALPEVSGPGECGISEVVRLDKIVLADGSLVTVAPPATMRCPMAAALAQWMNEIGLAAGEFKSVPVSITNQSSYVCRSRNNIPGAKLSEHAQGNALDVGSIKLANGRLIDLASRATPESFRQRVRAASCDRFNTVLGPGSDSFHETHIHLDLAERKNGYKICQWVIERPTEGKRRIARSRG
jgi:hypothetical protein